jgi:hypothetical protein
MRVGRLARTGLSNHEIAAQLLLSCVDHLSARRFGS